MATKQLKNPKMTNGMETNLANLINFDPGYVLLLREDTVTDALWELALDRNLKIFEYIQHPSRDVCLFVLKRDGRYLRYIIENTDIVVTSDMVCAAIETYPPAIFDVPEHLRYEYLKEYAIDKEPTLLRHFSHIRPEYIEHKLKQDPSFVRYLDNPSEDLICRAILNDPGYCDYIEHFTPKMLNLIDTNYPGLRDIISYVRGGDDDNGIG